MSKLEWNVLTKKRGSSTSQGIPPGKEEMRAALDVNIPNYATAVVTTNQVVESISSLQV